MASLPVTIHHQPHDLPLVMSAFGTPKYSNPYVESSPDVPYYIRYPPVVLENTVHTASFNCRQDMLAMYRALISLGCQLSKTRPRISLKLFLLTIAAFHESAVCTGARSHEEATEGLLSFQNAVLLRKDSRASNTVVTSAEEEVTSAAAPGAAEEEEEEIAPMPEADLEETLADAELNDDAVEKLAAEMASGKKRIRPKERDLAALKPPAPGRRRYDGLDTGHSRIGKVGFIEAVVVQNVVGTLRTGMNISLPITHREVLPNRSSYGDTFPGLILKNVDYPRILGTPDKFKPSLTMFSSGSAIITGAKTMSEIYQGACISASYIWRTFCLMQREPNALISILFSNGIDILTFEPVRRYLMDHNKGNPSDLRVYESRHDLINSASAADQAYESVVEAGLVRRELLAFNEILRKVTISDGSGSSCSSLSSAASSQQSSPVVVRVQSTTASPLGKRPSISPIPGAKRDTVSATDLTVAPLSSLGYPR